jgi:hypothetical protein
MVLWRNALAIHEVPGSGQNDQFWERGPSNILAGVESSVALSTWVAPQHLSVACRMDDAFTLFGWFLIRQRNPVNWKFSCVWLLATFELFPRHVVMLNQQFCGQSRQTQTKWFSTIQCPHVNSCANKSLFWTIILCNFWKTKLICI